MNCRFLHDIWQDPTPWAITVNSRTSKTKVTMSKLIHIANTYKSTSEVQKPSLQQDNLYLVLLIQCHTRFCMVFLEIVTSASGQLWSYRPLTIMADAESKGCQGGGVLKLATEESVLLEIQSLCCKAVHSFQKRKMVRASLKQWRQIQIFSLLDRGFIHCLSVIKFTSKCCVNFHRISAEENVI